MAGSIRANFLQLGDSLTATQNLTIRTNVDGTFTIARGNPGVTIQDISTINAAGGITFANDMTVSGASTFNGSATLNGATTITGTTSIPNLPPDTHPHFGGYFDAPTGVDPVPTMTQVLIKDMTFTSNKVYAQRAGRYYVKAQQLINSTTTNIYLLLRRNGGIICHAWMGLSMQDLFISSIVDMAVNDYIDFAYLGTVPNSWGGTHSNVSIFMV
jgi:hypothetical protein